MPNYCKRCVMNSERPGLVIDSEGICSACRHYEYLKNEVDWTARWHELENLCDKYRRSDSYYDCVVPVSGGKDSYYAVYILKEKLNMNPLLVCVQDNFTHTEAGIHNLNNIGEAFNCDLILLKVNAAVAHKMVRRAFETLGSPNWVYDRSIYVWPLQIAVKYEIPFVCWGENTGWLYGAPNAEDTASAITQISNDAVKDVGGLEYWLEDGITMKDLNTLNHPTPEEIAQVGLNPIYLSYFVQWSSYENMLLAKRYGFEDLDDTGEWQRQGSIEQWDSIDSVGYWFHIFMKYPKMGTVRVTDMCSRFIREERMTRKQAIMLVKEKDHILDPEILADFINFTGYTEQELWAIVDKWYNTDLFEKNEQGIWQLKYPIWEEQSL